MLRIAITSIVALVVAAALAAPGAVLAAAAAPLHLQDRAIMTYGIAQDLAQVALGELALERAIDPEVKGIAWLPSGWPCRRDNQSVESGARIPPRLLMAAL